MTAASVVVGGAGCARSPQVELVEGEQAVAQLALGGEADPVAGLAERLGDARDDADDAAGMPAAAGRGSGTARPALAPRTDRLEREDLGDAAHDLGLGHHLGVLQPPSASRGMNSMKRTITPSSRPKRAKSTTSSSLTPPMSTTLTFTGSRPASLAASMPSRTLASSSRRVVLEEAVAVAASRGRR